MSIHDEEFDRQYQAAVERGARALQTEPCAERAYYDRKKKRIVVELTNGCVFMLPPELVQGLRDATPDELAEVEVMPYGFALRWEKLDADFSVAGLLAGIFGTKAWMAELGRHGGKLTSEAKAAAARENGKKGGRPKKKMA